MAVKTFATGEVLTASDTNTYLANSGLVYITSGTLSSTTKDFTSVFSSSYRNYRIIIDQISFSGAADLYWQVLSGSTPVTTATYNWAFNGYTSGAAAANSGAAAQTVAYTGITNAVGVANTKIASLTMDVMNPNIAERTFALTQSASYTTAFRALSGLAENDNTTAYDGIRFLTNSAVTMGGNVLIYGWRQS